MIRFIVLCSILIAQSSSLEALYLDNREDDLKKSLALAGFIGCVMYSWLRGHDAQGMHHSAPPEHTQVNLLVETNSEQAIPEDDAQVNITAGNCVNPTFTKNTNALWINTPITLETDTYPRIMLNRRLKQFNL